MVVCLNLLDIISQQQQQQQQQHITSEALGLYDLCDIYMPPFSCIRKYQLLAVVSGVSINLHKANQAEGSGSQEAGTSQGKLLIPRLTFGF